MRVSVKTHPTERWNAYLNGERLTHAIEADDEAGYVVRYCLDEKGRVIIDNRHDPHLAAARTETLIGLVRLERLTGQREA